MASIRRLASGRWQAQVARQGVRRAQSFRTRREAQDWAARQEHLIASGAEAPTSRLTLGDAFERYAREVSPPKRGARWEMLRLDRLARDPIGAIRLGALTAADLADWRDRRLTEVAPGSVRREMVLISHCLTVARREWGWIARNPASDVRRPAEPHHRERRVAEAEIAALRHVAGLGEGAPQTALQRAVLAFEFAAETGMRAGEICSLRRRDLRGRVAHLPRTKNGAPRDVPLSSMAAAILARLGEVEADAPLFGLTSRQIDAQFRKARDRAGIDGLRFHDSRHEATWRLAARVEVLDLAKILGHRDLRMLMRYYNPSAAELAGRLG